MRLTLRSKLFAIVGTAAIAFLVLLVASAVISSRVAAQLASVQERHLPRVGLQPKLEADFEQLSRAFQDAVAAHDADALEQTKALRDRLYADLRGGAPSVDAAAIAHVHVTLDAYFSAAHEVARRMLLGETGEDVVDAMARMQAKRADALAAIREASAVDRAELARAFDDAQRAQAAGARLRLAVSITCLAVVILLSLRLSRGTLRSLEALTAGFHRVGRGQFDQEIRVETRDELADLGEHANAMAKSLAQLTRDRERAERVKVGHAGLAAELRGKLEPGEVAERAVAHVAVDLGAVCGAIYWLENDTTLELAGHYACAEGAVRSFEKGSGLVGQAALSSTLTVVSEPPPDYLRVKSGVGEGAPRAIVLAPLRRGERTHGVLELAFFRPWESADAELLVGLAEEIAVAMEMARSAAATSRLLAQSQALAKRLATQEEELRTTNEELEVQQNELRRTNVDLKRHTHELEAQRVVLEEKNVELAEARGRLEQKAGELARVSAYKSQFLANMSHELRTPLNSMLLLSNLLAENEGRHLTEKQVEFARTIHGAGTDLLGLINQVLDLAKVEAGKQAVRISDVALAGVVSHVTNVFGPLARRKDLALDVEMEPGLPPAIATDGQRLTQILNNLVGNAIKFSTTGGVRLRIRRPRPDVRFARSGLDLGSTIAFEVIDTGVGIAPEHQERVFAPFEQVDGATDRSHSGTGLGLSISKELASLLGGELSLESAPSKGSKFTCYLPLSANAARGARGRDGSSEPASAHDVDDDRGRLLPDEAYLLVVEDDPHFAARVGDAIHGQGLRYLVATDGRSALTKARARPPAGVVLDVKLPDIDGWTVMEELRRDAILRNVPVHFVSALDAAERGLAMGAVGYLAKPATHAELSTMVRSLAPTAESGPPILVLERPSDDATTIASMLVERRIGAVERASTTAEALEAIRGKRFSCVIVDVALPDMRGLDLLESLRETCGAAIPPICVYASRPLDKAEIARLETYAEAIVLEGGSAGERLLEEVRLFARRLRDGVNPRTTPPLALPANVRFDGRVVLVVDDDMRTVYALSAALRAKGVDVVVADNGIAALETLAATPNVDAVLMDIMMPEMDGYEAMRRIRAQPQFRVLPIIALTAKAMRDDRDKCIEAGATDYLPKPVDAAKLLALLQRALLSEPEAAREVAHGG
ncbi:MAG: response regulator [Labilithrix sp.]|nr:response regulator [Labilithrix sp.]